MKLLDHPQRWFLRRLLASPLAWIHITACAAAPLALFLARPVSAFGSPPETLGRLHAWIFLAGWTGAMLGARDLRVWVGALRLGGSLQGVRIEALLVSQRILVGQLACSLGAWFASPFELEPHDLLVWIAFDAKLLGVTLCVAALSSRPWQAVLGVFFLLGLLPAVLAGSNPLADRMVSLLGPPPCIWADARLEWRVLAGQATFAATCLTARAVAARSHRPTHASSQPAP